MTRVEKLEREIQRLNRGDLAAFQEWFREYDSAEWDRQIEEDIRAGRLEDIAEQALAEYKAGRTKVL